MTKQHRAKESVTVNKDTMIKRAKAIAQSLYPDQTIGAAHIAHRDERAIGGQHHRWVEVRMSGGAVLVSEQTILSGWPKRARTRKGPQGLNPGGL